MRTKRNFKKRRNSKSRKVGGFFNLLSKNTSIDSATCNPNSLNNLEESMDLYNEYQRCCPKNYGLKNTSSYCNNLDQKYKETKRRDMMETPSVSFQGYAPRKRTFFGKGGKGKTKKRGNRKH
jgi:hypothetical protein